MKKLIALILALSLCICEKHALINKEDLYAGRDNFIPISMIGTGM